MTQVFRNKQSHHAAVSWGIWLAFQHFRYSGQWTSHSAGHSNNGAEEILIRLVGGPLAVESYVHSLGISAIQVRYSERNLDGGANSQSRSPPKTVVITDPYATPDPRFSTGSGSTNVGAGCSRHSTGTYNHRATRVPSHPVWPKASCTLIGAYVRSTSALAIWRESKIFFAACLT